MNSPNPYQAPSSTQNPDSGQDWNYGLIAGRYFQCLAILGLISQVFQIVNSGEFIFDLTPLLMAWIAHLLIKRSETARSWVVVLCATMASMVLTVLGFVLFNGTAGISYSFGHYEWKDPPRFWTLAFIALSFIVFAIPVALLSNATAKSQFKKVREPIQRDA